MVGLPFCFSNAEYVFTLMNESHNNRLFLHLNLISHLKIKFCSRFLQFVKVFVLFNISVTELHRYGGGLMEGEGKDFSSPLDAKQGAVPSKSPADTIVASVASVPHSDGYHIGVPSQRLSNVAQRTGPRSHQKWKGPDKISLIYGDWIEDLE